jgi:hypothetical protein
MAFRKGVGDGPVGACRRMSARMERGLRVQTRTRSRTMRRNRWSPLFRRQIIRDKGVSAAELLHDKAADDRFIDSLIH